MSDTPKPPEGYENWLHYLEFGHLWGVESAYARGVIAELQQLRSKLRDRAAKDAAYEEAMAALAITHPSCAGRLPLHHAPCDLCRLFKREIEAGRFKP